MRLLVTLENARETAVPVNHQDLLTGVVYHLLDLSDPAYAEFLHDLGYGADEDSGRKRFKLFVFSGLRAPATRRRIEGSVLRFGPGTVEWQIASPVADFLTHCATGLLGEGLIRLRTAEFPIREVQTLPEPHLTDPARFTCLSPIVASVPLPDGPARYLVPSDGPLFSDAVRKNLLRKHTAVHGGPPQDDRFSLTFDPEYLGRASGGGTKLISFKGIKIRGALAPFTVTGSPELMRIGLDCGFGEKNAGGFGMVDVRGERL